MVERTRQISNMDTQNGQLLLDKTTLWELKRSQLSAITGGQLFCGERCSTIGMTAPARTLGTVPERAYRASL